jgi:hypothetical protein
MTELDFCQRFDALGAQYFADFLAIFDERDALQIGFELPLGGFQ